jgi:hypothetical protein
MNNRLYSVILNRIATSKSLMQASSYGILKTASGTNGNCCALAQKQEALTLEDIAPTWHGRLL